MSLFSFKASGVKSEGEEAVKFNSILDNLQDGVMVYDKDFKVSVFNAAAARIFKIGAKEIVGGTLKPDRVNDPKYTLLIQTIFPSLAPSVDKKTEPGIYPQIVDVSFPETNLEIRTSTNLLLPGDDNSGFVKVITDRTSEAMAHKAKSEFVHMAAHKLRGQITMTSWSLDILRKNEGLSADDKTIAQQGYEASQKLSKIVTDLLDVEKIEEGQFAYEFKDINIITFIEETLGNAEEYIKKNDLKIYVYLDHGTDESIIVKADPNNLGRAVSNILDNAIQYNIRNGTITVDIERVENQPAVRVSIKDSGIGIPPEQLEQVSKKFFRSDNAKKVEAEGSGLGLYIAKAIIKKHGGTMHIESVLGRGTTVSFTLPI